MKKTVRQCHRWCGEVVERLGDVEIRVERAEIRDGFPSKHDMK